MIFFLFDKNRPIHPIIFVSFPLFLLAFYQLLLFLKHVFLVLRLPKQETLSCNCISKLTVPLLPLQSLSAALLFFYSLFPSCSLIISEPTVRGVSNTIFAIICASLLWYQFQFISLLFIKSPVVLPTRKLFAVISFLLVLLPILAALFQNFTGGRVSNWEEAALKLSSVSVLLLCCPFLVYYTYRLFGTIIDAHKFKAESGVKSRDSLLKTKRNLRYLFWTTFFNSTIIFGISLIQIIGAAKEAARPFWVKSCVTYSRFGSQTFYALLFRSLQCSLVLFFVYSTWLPFFCKIDN